MKHNINDGGKKKAKQILGKISIYPMWLVLSWFSPHKFSITAFEPPKFHLKESVRVLFNEN